MKLIKLDRRHNLYHRGYHYAFVFNGWGHKRHQVEIAVREAEGGNIWGTDNTFFGKSVVNKHRGTSVTPYYIGFKNESTATVVLLKVQA